MDNSLAMQTISSHPTQRSDPSDLSVLLHSIEKYMPRIDQVLELKQMINLFEIPDSFVIVSIGEYANNNSNGPT